MPSKHVLRALFICFALMIFIPQSHASIFSWFSRDKREENRKVEQEEMQKQFEWWPTDAQPAPVKDEKGGFWWWPQQPGQAAPWGNRGYVYLYKIIFDYKEEELPPAQPQEMRPSLLIKKIIKNVKIYFDYNKSELRGDHTPILEAAVRSLEHNPEAEILVTGNCDARGSEEYNNKLGRKRGDSVKQFLLENGVPESRIKIISRGKLDAVAHLDDLVGMQKDRNAQFVIAEVEEVMIPAPEKPEDVQELQNINAQQIEEGKYLVEEEQKVESEVKVSTKEYTIQKNDNLWKIAQKELGSGYRWKYLYELNKDRIKDPNKLKSGTVILIPIE